MKTDAGARERGCFSRSAPANEAIRRNRLQSGRGIPPRSSGQRKAPGRRQDAASTFRPSRSPASQPEAPPAAVRGCQGNTGVAGAAAFPRERQSPSGLSIWRKHPGMLHARGALSDSKPAAGIDCPRNIRGVERRFDSRAGCRDTDGMKKDRCPGGPAFFAPLAPWRWKNPVPPVRPCSPRRTPDRAGGTPAGRGRTATLPHHGEGSPSD